MSRTRCHRNAATASAWQDGGTSLYERWQHSSRRRRDSWVGMCLTPGTAAGLITLDSHTDAFRFHFERSKCAREVWTLRQLNNPNHNYLYPNQIQIIGFLISGFLGASHAFIVSQVVGHRQTLGMWFGGPGTALHEGGALARSTMMIHNKVTLAWWLGDDVNAQNAAASSAWGWVLASAPNPRHTNDKKRNNSVTTLSIWTIHFLSG